MFLSPRVLTGSSVGPELVCQRFGGEGAASRSELSGAAGSSIKVHEQNPCVEFLHQVECSLFHG